MKTNLRIAGIGEVLMDVFEDGSATVGGAPLNVAFHAHQLLRSSGRGQGEIVSAVGTDPWGQHICDWLRRAGMSTEYVASNPRHPTGMASVFVREAEAGYEIGADAAWDHLTEDVALRTLATQCSAVAFGSLAQRRSQSAEALRNFVAAVNGHRLYDVNLRTNATDGIRGYSRSVLHESCKASTIVKANSGELEEVACLLDLPPVEAIGEARLWARMEQLLLRYRLFAVVVTRGAQGALLQGRDSRLQLADSTLAAEDVHPVGAGDAFSAGLLFGLCSDCTLESSARIAESLASWVTRFASATPSITPVVLAELRALEFRHQG